jgi:superfamily II DNA or RNA helicase
MSSYTVGSLVRCREREWVVLPPEPEFPDVLRLRPLGGGDSGVTGIYLPLSEKLGIDQIAPATFAPPDSAQAGDFTSGQLLRDAARLTFRTGAGPFRALGHLGVRPRPYQLVPLLMALRLEAVRLLIADDVGIGKTIEAGLIARELWDRGEVRRLAVLCPPHLCDQWQRELSEKFGLDPVVIRSGTIAQLERALPPGDISVFRHYPVQVVSIDFVKGERRRATFIQDCPELLIVDEAHTAARATGSGATQQRHALLRELAARQTRHLLLLTATPHSGVEDAFRSLLELLDPRFGGFDLEHRVEQERRELARHVVQRRRADVQRWLGEETPFPTRDPREVTYALARAPEYGKLFDDILSFARELVREDDGGGPVWRRRVRYWTALALLRCVMSSPAAAVATLRARIKRVAAREGDTGTETDRQLAQYVLDWSDQEVGQRLEPADEGTPDFEPNVVIEESEAVLEPGERGRLAGFLRRAEKLAGKDDPKAAVALTQIAEMLQAGYHPIVYCRYIATAEYLAQYLAADLRRRLPKDWADLQVIAVTGLSSEEEREQRVAELATNPHRVLVATDCLSEGINLQDAFDAVLHYDLPWNPNRLEQREGRVDRYGQPRKVVQTVMLWGSDNPIDAAVLKVLLRKAKAIHKSLGITVPLPMDSETVVETLVRSLLLEEGGVRPMQLRLFDGQPGVSEQKLEAEWDRAVAREQESRSRFAQHAIRPDEVQAELEETDRALGNEATVEAFVRGACARLDLALMPVRRTDTERPVWRLPVAALPGPVRERVERALTPRLGAKAPAEALIAFSGPVPEEITLVGRLHPLTEALAEYLIDHALEPEPATAPPASRSGVIRTAAVTRRTTLLLLRLRLLIEQTGSTAPQLAEEVVVAGFAGRAGSHTWLEPEAALGLLATAAPAGNLSPQHQQEQLAEALGWLDALQPDLSALADARAAVLRDAHQRVRQATRAGRVTVRPHLPLDVLGLYVLLPLPPGATGG